MKIEKLKKIRMKLKATRKIMSTRREWRNKFVQEFVIRREGGSD